MDLSTGTSLPADTTADAPPLTMGEMPAPIDEQALVAEVNGDYAEWARQKRPFEGNWYLNAAFLRGEQNAVYNSTQGRLITPQSPTYRVKPRINRILPKVRGRNAKFFKNRPKPVVIPASTERKDILDARGTEKAILYTWARQRMEEKHKDARSWATIGAKGFWWIRWNDALTARVMVKDATGTPQPQTLQLGDVEIEVGSPFELFVANPAEPRIGKQPKIIRARLRNRKDMMQRYPTLTKLANAGVGSADAPVRIADRIAQLNPNLGSGFNVGSSKDTHESMVLVIEHFTAPCATYPKGRYAVVIGDELAKVTPELPYEMWDHAYNPYPVIEFRDMLSAGQFWNTTVVEQLIDLQREYNEVRGLIRENLRAVSRPKIIVYKQHNLAEGAYTSQAGEVLELNWVPSLPPPIILQAANVANDCWNILALISKEFDDLSQIYPSAEGKAGQATSGYQTMLLQESADGVHAPDIREDEMAIEEAGWKIRRLMKLMYDVPRLISILGPNAAPEVMEFHNSQIDEFAEVRIQAGSMLPDLKAARIQTVQEMFKAGLFGNVQDPQVRRKVLEMIEIGGMDVTSEDERRDSDEANQENFALQQGSAILSAMFYEDHVTHVFVHQNALKTTEWIKGNPQQRLALIAHLITHYDFVNPALAGGLRQQFNMHQLPIATPPTQSPQPPPPPAPKLALGLTLKGEDLMNPVAQQILMQEGMHLQPPPPPPIANPVHTHGPVPPPQMPHPGAPAPLPPHAPLGAPPSAAPSGPAPTAPIPAR